MEGSARGRTGLAGIRIAGLAVCLGGGLCVAWANGLDGPRGGIPRLLPRPQELRALLPANDQAGAWTRDGDLQEFTGEDLYLYIDGGAAIYQEYGFAGMISQDYKTQGGKGLSLEIFHMATPEGAYGMFTFKRSAGGKPLQVGAEGQLEEYYVNFWKGPFLVTVTGFEKDEQVRQQLVPLAQAVARKIADDAARPPALVAKLPRSGLRVGSVRYFRGYLGFMNHYPSTAAEDFQVREGVCGEYAPGVALFILAYSGSEEAQARLAAVEKALGRGTASARAGASPDGSFSVIDGKRNKITLRAVGGYVLICVEDGLGQDSAGLFAAASRNLDKGNI
jgi:hypothetical protein